MGQCKKYQPEQVVNLLRHIEVAVTNYIAHCVYGYSQLGKDWL